jgi:hypothetical protein
MPFEVVQARFGLQAKASNMQNGSIRPVSVGSWAESW